MSQKTDSQLSTQSQQIANESAAGANTANRIGTLFQDITDSKLNLDAIDTNTSLGNSDSVVPSQKAVKDYVINVVGSIIAGPTGPQGDMGPQGIAGLQGLQGIIGPQGSQGYVGSTGAPGATGAVGSQGVRGLQGSQGLQGDGAQGAQGLVSGFQGDIGFQGYIGFQGNAVQGFQGNTGSIGFQGNIGFQGTVGFQGATGQNNYAEYSGKFSQTGTDSPSEKVRFVDSITTSSRTWEISRSGIGEYSFNIYSDISSPLDSQKIDISFGNSRTIAGTIVESIGPTNQVCVCPFYTFDIAGATADDILNFSRIDVKIYNSLAELPFSPINLTNLLGWWRTDYGVGTTAVAEVRARANNISTFGTSGYNDGATVSLYYTHPLYGDYTMGSYQKQSGDTDTIIAQGIFNNIAGPTSGVDWLGASASLTNYTFFVTAPPNLGSSINGLAIGIFTDDPIWGPGYSIQYFQGGYDPYNKIMSVVDQSGNGYGLTANTGRINVSTTLGSYNVFSSPSAKVTTNAGGMHTLSMLPILNSYTIFMVAAQGVTGSKTDNTMPFYGIGSNESINRNGTTNNVFLNSRSWSGVSGTPATINNSQLYSYRVEAGATGTSMFINNSFETSTGGTASVPANYLSLLHNSYVGGNANAYKQIAEFIICSGTLSSTEITAAENYLKNKYSLY